MPRKQTPAGGKGIPPTPGPGRPKGVMNKRPIQLMQELRQTFAEHNLNPALELAAIANDPNTDTTNRVRCWAALLPYLYPRLQLTAATTQTRSEVTVRLEREIAADPKASAVMRDLIYSKLGLKTLGEPVEAEYEDVKPPVGLLNGPAVPPERSADLQTGQQSEEHPR